MKEMKKKVLYNLHLATNTQQDLLSHNQKGVAILLTNEPDPRRPTAVCDVAPLCAVTANLAVTNDAPGLPPPPLHPHPAVPPGVPVPFSRACSVSCRPHTSRGSQSAPVGPVAAAVIMSSPALEEPQHRPRSETPPFISCRTTPINMSN